MATSTTLSTSKAEVLIPVEFKRTAEGDAISLNKHNYRIEYSRRIDRQVMSTADQQKVVVTQLYSANPASSNLSAKLQLLGNIYNEQIPAPLQAYIKGNQVNLIQLAQLASRAQGYPLGEAKVVAGMVSLAGALAFTTSNNTLPSGTYGAAIIVENGQLHLSLTAKLGQIAVTLSPMTLMQAPKQESPSQQLATLPSLTSTYSQLSQHLAKQAVPQSQLATLQNATAVQLSSNAFFAANPLPLLGEKIPFFGPMTARDDAIIKATNLYQLLANIKIPFIEGNRGTTAQGTVHPLMLNSQWLTSTMGSTSQPTGQTLGPPSSPIHRGLSQALQQLVSSEATHSSRSQVSSEQSLLSLVKQQLALAFPRPLADLAVPNILQRELIDTLAGIASPLTAHTSAASHSGTIAVLFQLLLGRNLQQNSQVDASKYLMQLQRQVGASSSLLRLLDKAGVGESMGKLLSGLSLYQQASSDNNQGINWYFALPYTLDNKQEELEGHFEQTTQDADNKNKWRLQLKFNLTSGSLLINADIKQQQLNLSFTSDSKPLLTSIDLRLEGLQQKLTNIGMRSINIITQQNQVPASLLPGEHYLVKIKA